MNNLLSYFLSYTCDKFNIRRKPVVLNFPITDNCNSRCLMCNVWVDKVDGELSAKEIGEYFCNPLFSNVMHVGVSGGEPTLRRDLVDCVDKIIDSLPNLKTLSITTHGYHHKRWGRFLPKILELADKNHISFSLNISLDGVGSKHDEIRGTLGAFERATQTAKLAIGLSVPVQFQCTVCKSNLYAVGKVLRYAKKLGADIVFRKAVPIERLYNKSVVAAVELNAYEDSYLADFFSSQELLGYTKSRARRIYYRSMAKTLEMGGGRSRPCHFQRQGAFLGSKGDLYNCSLSDIAMGNIKEKDALELYSSPEANDITQNLISTTCKTCLHDQGGAWEPWQVFSDAFYSNEKLSRAYELLCKSSVSAFRLISAQVNARLPAGTKWAGDLQTAYVIGAYGGEHVGDSAILGGVCLRLKKNHGIKKIFVESFRVNRTRKWAESLVLPVTIEVVEYGSIAAKNAFLSAGLVVYGGGPLMEMPYQLAKHYLTLSKAKKRNKNILLEGVGIGPVKTELSRFIIDSMLGLADIITVRTPEALDEVNHMGKVATLSGDPAFDYLDSRGLPEESNAGTVKDWLTGLKDAETELVGINLRPLWGKYNFSDAGQNIEDIYKKFIQEISQGLLQYAESVEHKVVFAFVPLNPDQYGFSDLNAAYDLEEVLGDRVAFQIMEYEPTVDELLEILKPFDTMISMRFHGCIFALSLEVPNVVGIDYQAGKSGKVTEIMSARGFSDKVMRVDKFSAEWLVEQLGKNSEHPDCA